MPDPVPPWLATMREIDNTHWAPGDGPNPTILGWLRAIGTAFPNMASYCDAAGREDYFSWCGLAVGNCMAKAGMAPVFGATDTGRFLFAMAWLGWGSPVAKPQPGDVVVFDFGGGDHHVTLFDHDNGNGTWSCHGGNQGHQVKLSNFPASKVMGVRHPTAQPNVAAPELAPTAVKPATQRFADCVALVLHDEGGNDDDPRDPGGRTSRGILQREWDVWRQAHPGLPADVFDAPQDQIIAIYHQKYWTPLSCDDLPAGVDYAVFDNGVLSGIGRAARVLQGIVGAAVDGEIGPETLGAVRQANPAALINRICDERLAFLQSLSTFETFGKGWTRRVQGVRVAALAMSSAAGTAPAPTPPLPLPTDSPLAQLMKLIQRLEMTMADTTAPVAGQPAPNLSQPNLAALIQQAINLVQAIQTARTQPAGQAPGQQPQDQIKQVMNVLGMLLGTAPAKPADGTAAPLGQVNGALGQSIGSLLDGKKSAIGIIGSLLTAVLQAAGPSTPLASILPFLGTAAGGAGLSQVALPVFLAIAAWGVLGKMEKWAGPTATPTTPAK